MCNYFRKRFTLDRWGKVYCNNYQFLFTSASVPEHFKSAVVQLFLKNPSPDLTLLNNCHCISKLSFPAKALENNSCRTATFMSSIGQRSKACRLSSWKWRSTFSSWFWPFIYFNLFRLLLLLMLWMVLPLGKHYPQAWYQLPLFNGWHYTSLFLFINAVMTIKLVVT